MVLSLERQEGMCLYSCNRDFKEVPDQLPVFTNNVELFKNPPFLAAE